MLATRTRRLRAACGIRRDGPGTGEFCPYHGNSSGIVDRRVPMRAIRARLFLAAACCGVALTCVPPVGAAPGVLLRYHFIAGQQTPQQMVLGLAGSIPVIAPNVALAEMVPFTQTVMKVYPD